MRIIQADNRFEVQSCGKHNHEFLPIHKNAGSKRASHFGEETIAKIGKRKQRASNNAVDAHLSSVSENFHDEVLNFYFSYYEIIIDS